MIVMIETLVYGFFLIHLFTPSDFDPRVSCGDNSVRYLFLRSLQCWDVFGIIIRGDSASEKVIELDATTAQDEGVTSVMMVTDKDRDHSIRSRSDEMIPLVQEEHIQVC